MSRSKSSSGSTTVVAVVHQSRLIYVLSVVTKLHGQSRYYFVLLTMHNGMILTILII